MATTRRPGRSLDPAADFLDDGGTSDWHARRRQRNREALAALGWAGARVVLFFPLVATITVPVGGLAYGLAAFWTGYDSALAILIGITVGMHVAAVLIRDAGGMAFFGQPIRMRTRRPLQNFLDAPWSAPATA